MAGKGTGRPASRRTAERLKERLLRTPTLGDDPKRLSRAVVAFKIASTFAALNERIGIRDRGGRPVGKSNLASADAAALDWIEANAREGEDFAVTARRGIEAGAIAPGHNVESTIRRLRDKWRRRKTPEV